MISNYSAIYMLRIFTYIILNGFVMLSNHIWLNWRNNYFYFEQHFQTTYQLKFPACIYIIFKMNESQQYNFYFDDFQQLIID